MSGPSAEARAVACQRIGSSARMRTTGSDIATDVLLAAHDPALGLDRSVCLRDVVEAVRALNSYRGPGPVMNLTQVGDFIERRFTESGRGSA